LGTAPRLVASLTILLASGGALAQPYQGPSLSGLPEPVDHFGLLATDRSAVLDQLNLSVRADSGYVYNGLRLPGDNPQVTINHHFLYRASLGLGLVSKYLQLGVVVPSGDMRAYLKVGILQRNHVGLAIIVGGIFPTGDPGSFRGNGQFGGEAKVVVDFSIKWFGAAVNLGTRIFTPFQVKGLPPGPAMEAPTLFELGPELLWALGLTADVHKAVRLALEAAGSESFVPAFQAAQRTAGLFVSLFGRPSESITLYAGLGRSLAPGAVRTDDVRVMLGMSWSPRMFRRPAEQASTPAVLPLEEVAPPDLVDRHRDRDSDGIPDFRDACPDDPEDMDGYEDSDGCPELDNDSDGIPDEVDLCPNVPETVNGVQDSDGCPESDALLGPRVEMVLPQAFRFPRGSAGLSAAQESELDQLAKALFDHREVKRLRLEGHAWQEGKPDKALALAQRRADAVRTHLLRKGIEGDRLQAVGYGDGRPLDKGSSAEAAARNRRVEFILVDR
jgi:outer membrane protein OmpA-like peptidoglycan-associated protein